MSTKKKSAVQSKVKAAPKKAAPKKAAPKKAAPKKAAPKKAAPKKAAPNKAAPKKAAGKQAAVSGKARYDQFVRDNEGSRLSGRRLTLPGWSSTIKFMAIDKLRELMTDGLADVGCDPPDGPEVLLAAVPGMPQEFLMVDTTSVDHPVSSWRPDDGLVVLCEDFTDFVRRLEANLT